MLKAILFDLDNTLIDFMHVKKSSADAGLNAMIAAGLKIDQSKARRTLYELYDKYGIEHQEIFQKFLHKVEKKIDYKILASGIVAYRKQQAGIMEPYGTVMPTLIKLREKGLKLAIITDAPRIKAWMRLTELKLGDFFDVVVTFDDTKKYKPDPAPFEKAMKLLNVGPDECMMVGDWAERDITGANKLGITSVFARYGAVRPLKDSKADYELKQFTDLLDVIEKVQKL